MRKRWLIGQGNQWEAILNQRARRSMRRRGHIRPDGKLIRRPMRRGLGPTWGKFYAAVDRQVQR